MKNLQTSPSLNGGKGDHRTPFPPLYTLDLFSGIGGFSLGLKEEGFRTIAFCEREPYAQGILLQKMAEGILDCAPIHKDITTLDGKPMRGYVDVITGGFPCQDLSEQGRRVGIDGERSGLWREYARLIGEIQPRFVLVENVPGLLVRGMGRVCGDLARLGYDCEWSIISAASMGAPHRRERVWIVAYANQERLQRMYSQLQFPEQRKTVSEVDGRTDGPWVNLPSPKFCRGSDGIPHRIQRLEALGNSLLPQIAAFVGRRVRELNDILLHRDDRERKNNASLRRHITSH